MKILSNGSTFAGQAPDSVAELLAVLDTETLDPTFEEYGRFFLYHGPDDFQAWGNFLTVSRVFDVRGTLAELLPLARALKANRRQPAYLRAREARRHRQIERPWKRRGGEDR